MTSFRVAADLRNSSRVRHAAAAVATDAGLSPERVFDLKVAVSEAVANAVEHACTPGDDVDIDFVRHTDRLEILIHSPREFCIEPAPPGSRSHRGLGLPLMASLADQLMVRKRPDGGSTVTLGFFLTRDPSIVPPLQHDPFQAITDGFLAMDRNWRIVYVNDAALSAVGKAREQVLGEDVWSLFPEVFASDFYMNLRRAMDEQMPADFDGFYAPASVWLHVRAYPASDGISVCLSNVTERKQREQDTLEISRERQRAAEEAGRERDFLMRLLDNVSVPIAYIDAGMHVRQANAALALLTGLSAGELVGGYFPDFNRDNQEAVRIFSRVLMSGEPFHGLMTLSQFVGRGDNKTLLVSMVPDRDQAGNVVGAIAYAIDMTELVGSQQALSAERNRMRSVVATLPVGVVISDARGEAIEANDEFRRIFRLDHEAELSRAWAPGVARWPETGEPVAPGEWTLFRAMEMRRMCSDEAIEIERADGTRGFVRNSAVPILDDFGGLTGGVAVVQDVSDQYRRELFGQTLNEINALIGSTPYPEAVLQQVVEMGAQAMGSEAAGIAVREEGRWVPRYVHGLPLDIRSLVFSEEDFPSSPPYDSEPRAFTEAAWDTPAVSGGQGLLTRSGLNIPLAIGDELFGTLAFHYRSRSHHFGHDEIDFARKLAAAVSQALRNARLLSSLQREVRQLAAVTEVANLSALTSDLHDLSFHVLEILNRHLGLKLGGIYRLDPATMSFDPLAVQAADNSYLPLFDPLPASDHSIIGQLLVHGLSYATHDDWQLSGDIAHRLDLEGAGDDRWVALSLNHQGRMLGALALVFEGRRSFRKDELALYESIARHLTMALENVRLFQSKEEQLSRLTLLRELALAASRSLQPEEVARLSLAIAHREMGARLGRVYIINENGSRFEPLASLGDPAGSDLFQGVFDERANLERIISRSAVALTSEDDAHPTISLDSLVESDDRWIMLPITRRDTIVGALALVFPGRRPLHEGEISLYRGVAGQLASAIENARLYQSERKISQTLQQALLTVSSSLGGVTIGHLYRSATSRAEVGGDFYDLFPLHGHLLGILIGDVSGKGLPAASMAGNLKATVRAYSHDDSSPATVISRTNHLLADIAPLGTFATAIYAVLDISTGRLSVCCAGHPPLLIRKQDGRVERHDAVSPVLGVFGDARYCEKQLQLQPGDVLLLYTDGLIEARNARRELYGEERLLAGLSRTIWAGAVEIPDILLREVMAFSGNSLGDDLAVLAIALEGERQAQLFDDADSLITGSAIERVHESLPSGLSEARGAG